MTDHPAHPVDGRVLLAANLRRLRTERKLSQEALADLAGIHRTYLGSVERAERNVAIDNICRLAGALGVDVRDLLAPVPLPRVRYAAERRGRLLKASEPAPGRGRRRRRSG